MNDDLDQVQENVEAAWAAEIRRRLEDIRSGRVRPIDWNDARRTLRAS